MQTKKIAKIVPLFRGAYDATAQYLLNDIVSYSGNAYWHTAHQSTVGVAPSDTTVWKLIVSGGGGGGSFDIDALDAETTIAAGDELPFYDVSAGEAKKITWSNLLAVIGVPQASNATPQALGTAAAGSGTKFARDDHVHGKPTPADIGAIALPVSPSSGQFLSWNGSAWVAVTLTNYAGEVV